MDASEHYRQLLQLGREEFLASAAPAALVRYRREGDEMPSISGFHNLTLDADSERNNRSGEYITEEAMPLAARLQQHASLEVYPLAKKTGASFPDRITIGRTSNNDVVIVDTSVSRLHAYIKRSGSGWLIADAGSKNGTFLAGTRFEPRKEQALVSRLELRIGDVDVTFYVAADLFVALGGT